MNLSNHNRSKPKLWLIIFFTLICHSLGAQNIYHERWIDFNKNNTKDIYEDPTATIEDRIENLLSQMTIDEKTCQMVTLYGYGRVAKDELPTKQWMNKLWKDGLGNIDEASNGVYPKAKYKYPYNKHVWALNEIQKFFIEKTRLGIPVEFTNEGIRGLNHYKSTSFPAQIGMGCTWNKSLMNQIGKCIGQEGFALGYHNIYSPVLDVARDQRWGRIVESFGEDPFLVSQYGVEIVTGIQSQGVSSTLKHFAVYSAPKGARDGHVRLDPHITVRELHNIYLYPFKQAIKKGHARGIMSSYNDYDGVPITGSYYFLTELLRNQYGFDGYVVSDSDAVAWLHSKHRVATSYKDAVYQSVMAGLNIRTTFNDPMNFVLPLRELINEKKIPITIIDNRIRDILRVKFKEGLFDSPLRDPKKVNRIVRSDKHIDLSKQASKESLVLLKNRDNLLPLDISKYKNILVVGPTAQSKSSSISRYGALGIDVITGYRGIKSAFRDKATVDYAKGSELYGEKWPDSEVYNTPMTNSEEELIKQAITKAQKSDIIIAFMGEDETMVGENLTRTNLDLPASQKRLLMALKKCGKPIIMVLINGRPLSINYASREMDAIICAWFPGEFGGEAIADVITGQYNPAGRLSTTWLRSVGQIPFNFPYKPSSQLGQAQSGPNGTGDSRVVTSLYPFGYGLSYSNFQYNKLQINNNLNTPNPNLQISFLVTNISNIDGDEVPQLYIQDEYSSVTTYAWQLRGFDRIHIKAGQSKRIVFNITLDDLELLNRNMKQVVEPGTFKLAIGTSSKDIRLEGQFSISDNK
ncbi:glycoside hydrolase family 3 C-terminal domain-containing protein [Halosquirtibacter xylanolyticus]|uniref:glycoside hydrolase family 3 N-terminal domain-containing protein n=1 Tax=Halosquirtibacter xylanolyticus TaxID=3374599 RepID=UPI00374986F2|nr:glycoside hydrolase family 3 C-terminal domain-containing protein [Prolixibacteraceae bacterium]